jgi:predicted dithiol-disulfide oxidoreductase (DUF899 family)
MATERKDPTTLHAMRFPGESADYRAARDRLLREEAALRRHIEDVAALRRGLPLGGPVADDYVFEEGSADLDDVSTVREVRLSNLFERGKNTLVAYSFMYGPAMEKPCPMCTAMLDSLNGTSPHARQRVNLVVVAKSPLERIRTHARARGWRNLRLLSSAGNAYNRDYHADAADGSQNPILNVFVKRDGAVHHSYATELLFAKTEAGQNPRHVDSIWPLWNLFDLTPEGRGEDWYPRLGY